MNSLSHADAPTLTTAQSQAQISPLTTTKDAWGESLQKTMIWAPDGAPLESPFLAFRKSFSLQNAPRRAMMHLFGDARYMVWLNGQHLLRGPARFEPSGPEYDSMDVTRFLKPGANSLVVLVMANPSNKNGKMRRHVPGLAVALEADGVTTVSTDETWKWSDKTRYRSPAVTWANVSDRIDARVEDGDWTQPEYNDNSWKRAAPISGEQWGPLSARRIPLLRDTEIKPQFAPGQTLPATLSAGQSLTFSTENLVQAYTVLELDAEEGSEISLDYTKVNYLARAGRQTYISSDTSGFFGGSISVKSGRVTIRALKLVERLYPFDVTGSFRSNDEALNKLWATCVRSCQVLSEDAYVDCADRERVEWMDCDPPGFDVTRTALTGTSDDGQTIDADARLLGAMLRRTALSVQPEGWVKAHTASDRFDIHAKMEDRSCDWVQGARRYYESTGDAVLIREIWPVIVRQMNYFLDRRTPRGLVHGREWVVWGNPIGYVTCEGAGLNAFVYKALMDAAFLGEVIGEKPQAAQFDGAAKKLATAFNSVLWNEAEGTYFSGYYAEADHAKADDKARQMKLKVEKNLIEPTMFPALFALDQGIVPPQRRKRVARYLFAHRQQAARLMTFYYLFSQQYGADTPAFDREILQTMRERWKGMIEWPWQTTWEDFTVSNRGSKAHIYGIFPSYFLSAYVLGVRPDGPALNKRLLIEPRLGDLSFAEGVVVTEHGAVPVSWKIDAAQLSFRVEIPQGVRATLRIPQTGANARLTLDGKAGAGKIKGRYFVTEVAAGIHQGAVTFEPA